MIQRRTSYQAKHGSHSTSAEVLSKDEATSPQLESPGPSPSPDLAFPADVEADFPPQKRVPAATCFVFSTQLRTQWID